MDKCESISDGCDVYLNDKYDIQSNDEKVQIERFNIIKDLGGLNFDQHINETVEKAYKMLSYVRETSQTYLKKYLFCYLRQWLDHIWNMPMWCGFHTSESRKGLGEGKKLVNRLSKINILRKIGKLEITNTEV